MISVCSQKGVQLSSGRLFLEEIEGKFTQSLIISWENMPPGGPVFNIWLKAWLQVINSLTCLVWCAIQRLDTTILIPHQQFTACLHGYKGLEVDLTTVLHLEEVLFFVITCTVHKPHPVTVIFICTINNVADFSTFKNLANKHRKVTSCTRK